MNIKEIELEIKELYPTINIVEIKFIEEDKLLLNIEIHENEDEKAIKQQLIELIKIAHNIPKLKLDISKIKELTGLENAVKILVASGKGGVGKSSVTANLAIAFEKLGNKVAIIDADIYGSSIPLILGIEGTPSQFNGKLLPMKYNNIEFIGTYNLNPSQEPIIWRGPMLGRMLNSFFNDVLWNEETNILLIDLPPGTGDVPLDLTNLIPDAKTIIITTPSEIASKVAIKAGQMSLLQKHEIIGVIENMSYYNHNDEKLYIFGENGGEFVAKELNTNLLGQIPIEKKVSINYYSDIANIILSKINR